MIELIGVTAAAIAAYIAVKSYGIHRREEKRSISRTNATDQKASGDNVNMKVPPEGVSLLPKVLCVPTISDYFDRPLWLAGRCQGHTWHVAFGEWVTARDPIVTFEVLPKNTLFSELRKSYTVSVVAPVTGLVVSKREGVFDHDGGSSSEFFVLEVIPCRPVDLPETADSAYRRFASEVYASARTLFCEWTERPLEPETLQKELKSLVSRPLKVKNLDPYRDRIDELWQHGVPATIINQLRSHLQTAAKA